MSQWLTSLGFEITRQDKNHLAVFARGKISLLQTALHTSFARVTYEGVEYTSAVTAPNVPTTLSPLLVGINGLQPHIRMHKNLTMRPSSLTGTNPPYLPSQIAQAYNANGLYSSNVTGAGQTIAIAIDTFPNSSDLVSFWQTYGISQSINNISFIQVVPGTLPAPSGEETLDAEWSSSIAPGVKVRLYASQSYGFSNLDEVYQQIYTDVTNHPEYGIHQMSMSYGLGETYTTDSQVQTDDQYFLELASAGVTLFASTGDGGSTPGPNGGGDVSGPLQVYTPASDPNVTAVGGTSLYLNSDGSVNSETVWNSSSVFGSTNTSATGGGQSIYFNRPYWQSGTGVPAGTARLVPDVSSAADPSTGAVLIFNGTQYTIGGTSWSTPTWAGFCALINQGRANASLSSIGLLGPEIYPQIGTSNFRDITVGNNATANSGGLYSATVGYDMASGIGVPNVQTLAQTLLSLGTAPSFGNGPPTPTATIGVGYSFTYIGNGSPLPVFSLVSGNLPTGLTLSTAGVISGTPTQVGLFTGTIQASNGIGSAATQNFSITVEQPPAITNGPPPSPATAYAPYSFTYTATGSPAPAFSLTSGNLPTGLTLSANGVLAGTPTQAGSFSGTVTASNGVNPSASQTFTINVQALTAPAFTNATLSTITAINGSLNFTYTAAGYPAPTFNLTAGALPPGTSLSSSGVVSGAPTQTGTYTGTVTASNGVSPVATQNFTIVVVNFIQQYSVLHNFGDGSVTNDGTEPECALVQGADGNFYGTTAFSGSTFRGTAFKITPQGTETTLYNFSVYSGGFEPAAGLLLGSDGNFYGTAPFGGTGMTAKGTVYMMTPQGVVTELHTFGDGSVTNDGNNPMAPLIQGSDGNFYGTTSQGGSTTVSGKPFSSKGTIFKMTSQGTETILHNFGDGSVANDGIGPVAALVQGSDGNFYGTTPYGGSGSTVIGSPYSGDGTIFKMTPQGVVTILHNFDDGSVTNDGCFPNCALVLGSDGNFYGTTKSGGGSVGNGTVFKVTPQGAVTILHYFMDGSVNNDGGGPEAGLILGNDGNFYGTTTVGGSSANKGAIFRMTPQGAVTILHGFTGVPNDGISPAASLVQGSDGSFYGTTPTGGTGPQNTFGGVAFKLTLATVPPVFTSATSTTFTVGEAGNFTVTALGIPSPTFSASGLPTWASFNPTTGVISGTPPNTNGTPITITLTASNGVSPNATQNLTINLATITEAQSPVFTSAPPPTTAPIGSSYSFNFTATGSPAPTFSLSSGTLPPGLTLYSTGLLSGTPTQSGAYSGTVTASNGDGTGVTQNFTITITDTDTPTMPFSGLVILAVALMITAIKFFPRSSIGSSANGRED